MTRLEPILQTTEHILIYLRFELVCPKPTRIGWYSRGPQTREIKLLLLFMYAIYIYTILLFENDDNFETKLT